jgi:hypothetical protein
MAVRTDDIQLRLSFITDESRTLAKTLQNTQKYTQEIAAANKQIKDHEAELKKEGTALERKKELQKQIKQQQDAIAAASKKIVEEGRKVEKLDLTKVAPVQLEARLKQVRAEMKLMADQGSDAFKALQAESNRLNAQLKEVYQSSKKIDIGQAVSGGGGFFRRALETAAGVFGGLSFDNLISSALDYGKKLLGIGVELDGLSNKMRTVFGESEVIINAFAERNARSIGLARDQYKQLATAVGDLLIPMGFSQQTAAALSVELVNQGGVLAEWSQGKVTAKEATEILNKALLGERDALNSLGIDIKQSLVDDELKRRGLSNLTGESLRQAEALVTLDLITRQSTSANEAFAKGADSLLRKKAELTAQIAEESYSLSKLLAPAYQFFIDLTQKAVLAVSALGKGFNNLFSGNLSKAYEYFTRGFSIEDLATQATAGQKEAEAIMSKSASGLATALGGGLEKEFERLKKTGTRSAKSVAEEQAKRLQNALKEEELFAQKREFTAQQLRENGLISEREHGNLLASIQQQQLEKQLEVYRKFGKEKERAALDIQAELYDIEQGKKRPAAAPLIGQAASSVQSQVQPKLFAERLGENTRQVSLRERFRNILFGEQQLEIEREKIRLESVKRQLQILKEAGATETEEYKRIADEKKQIEKNLAKDEVDIERQKREAKFAIAQTLGEALVAIERNRLDEQTNSALTAVEAEYKAKIQAAEGNSALQTRLQQELEDKKAKIEKQAAERRKILAIKEALIQGALAVIKALPNIFSAAAAGVAAAAQVAIISSQKFARGGFARFGFFGGRPHSAGGTKGYFDDGTAIEVERDEAFAVVNKRNAPMLRLLSRINAAGGHGDAFFERGGVPKFADGGLPAVNTTPSAAAVQAVGGSGQLQSMEAFVKATTMFYEAVRQMPEEVKARVVLTELRQADSELSSVQSDASL